MAGVDDQFTKTLIHFNGSDTSTTITDESGRAWTCMNSAQLDTGQKKFGTAALMCEKDTSDYIRTTNVTDFQTGTGDFTYDCWVKFETAPAAGSSYDIFGHGTVATPPYFLGALVCVSGTSDFRARITVHDGTNTYIAYSPTGKTIDTAWHHMAVIKVGDAIGAALDGDFDTFTALSASFSLPTLTGAFAIGRCGTNNANYLDGWVDEFRFSRCARWTADFTPWTVEYYKKFRPIVVVS